MSYTKGSSIAITIAIRTNGSALVLTEFPSVTMLIIKGQGAITVIVNVRALSIQDITNASVQACLTIFAWLYIGVVLDGIEQCILHIFGRFAEFAAIPSPSRRTVADSRSILRAGTKVGTKVDITIFRSSTNAGTLVLAHVSGIGFGFGNGRKAVAEKE